MAINQPQIKTASNRNYKDSVFRFLFGSSHPKWTLSLFNALSGKEYTDPAKINYREMEDVLYISMKEDVVFLADNTLNFYEHQSTWSPNMPYRMLEYAAKQFLDVVGEEGRRFVYSEKLIRFPKPKFYMFYNGTDKEFPEEMTLKLSSSYDTINRIESLGDEYDLEVVVHVININHADNEGFPVNCGPLKEYTWVVSFIQEVKRQGKTTAEAIRMMFEAIPKHFEIRDELLRERWRITEMLFDEEWNKEQLERMKLEYYDDGHEAGVEDGINKRNTEVARELIREGFEDPFVLKISKITPELLGSLRKETAMFVN